jgi:NAD-dependent DNA ligase
VRKAAARKTLPPELRDFDRRVRELLHGAAFQYATESKLDGLSMAAHYHAGALHGWHFAYTCKFRDP